MDRPLPWREQAVAATAGRQRARTWTLRVLGMAAVLSIGLWLRSLPPAGSAALARWLPGSRAAVVTLYFADGEAFFPVSREMPAGEGLPEAALRALLAGPREGTGLSTAIPAGVEIRSFRLADGVAWIDLSAAFPAEAGAAAASVVQTMTALPGINAVALSVEGRPLGEPAGRAPLLYFASAKGLVAVPASAAGPREALERYLAGPADAQLIGLPREVRLEGYEHGGDGLISLRFNYPPAVRALALEQPQRMRLVLLGLIATLTEFPAVRAVQLDFAGQSRLGLGQCSDLLGTPQTRPRLLNDERLLGP